MKVVRAAECEGMNMSWNLNLFSGPKLTIRCGSCSHTFTNRIPLIDNPTVQCPACKDLNRLPLKFTND